MRSIVLTLAFVGLASPALATTCEESFQKKGDFFNGSAFAARVQVEGGTVEKVFSQLRPILARDGIKTLSTDVSTGVLKAENPATLLQRALPIDVYATVDGTLLNVEMVFTLPSGVGARRETVREHLCSALNQLLPKETAVVPVKDDATTIEVDAATLAKQVKESADNPARLKVNFTGKTFRVNGKVLSIAENAGSYMVSFDSGQPASGNTSTDKTNRVTVLCTMAKNQDAAVAALQTNQRATLVGRFQGFDSKVNAIQLQDCVGR
ncbi:OB-fold protein [Stenomitos frigidus]|uniref:DUF2993 domain-containing protein n=1 Tax=Stenomitos frigidus ULC18 TaxID=2107698 RepID=A0A2T1DUY1_9CYAN|nr:hypothetical protein [Stenomitos frigidus]PSB24272.1 hypothetical protein C7B82_27720 [Stenomitos frigidus ULC18]